MGRKFNVKIKWLPELQGGRQTIPIGRNYAPIIEVKECPSAPGEYWSVIVEHTNMIESRESLAIISYLSEEAPNNLEVGHEFVLYEGPSMVANGVVLSECFDDKLLQ